MMKTMKALMSNIDHFCSRATAGCDWGSLGKITTYARCVCGARKGGARLGSCGVMTGQVKMVAVRERRGVRAARARRQNDVLMWRGRAGVARDETQRAR